MCHEDLFIESQCWPARSELARAGDRTAPTRAYTRVEVGVERVWTPTFTRVKAGVVRHLPRCGDRGGEGVLRVPVLSRRAGLPPSSVRRAGRGRSPARRSGAARPRPTSG